MLRRQVPRRNRRGRRDARRVGQVLAPGGLVHAAVDEDDAELAVVLQHGDVLQRVAVDQDAVGVVARLDLAQVAAAHHLRRHARRRRDDGLVRAEPQQLDEVLQVARVRAVRRPGEAVVTVNAKKRLVRLMRGLRTRRKTHPPGRTTTPRRCISRSPATAMSSSRWYPAFSAASCE